MLYILFPTAVVKKVRHKNATMIYVADGVHLEGNKYLPLSTLMARKAKHRKAAAIFMLQAESDCRMQPGVFKATYSQLRAGVSLG